MGLIHEYLLKKLLKICSYENTVRKLRQIHDTFLSREIVRRCVLKFVNPNLDARACETN